MNKGKYTATAKYAIWELYAVKEKFQPGKTERLISEALKDIETLQRELWQFWQFLQDHLKYQNFCLLPAISYWMNLLKLKNFSTELARSNNNCGSIPT